MREPLRYLITRVAYALVLWGAVMVAAFLLFHLVPSDPARVFLGPNASTEQVAAVRERLGLDRPIVDQFFEQTMRTLSFDLGRSWIDNRPVAAEVGRKLILSLALAALATAMVAIYLAFTLFLDAAFKRLSLTHTSDFLCSALPTLFIGVIIALVSVAWYPYTYFSGALNSASDWLFLLPPAFVLALYPMGVLGRLARNQIRTIETSDFVRAARARGLGTTAVFFNYTLRNTWVPLLAAFGNLLPLFLTSAFIVEIVFSVPGTGSLLLKSVLERDLPMLEGIILVTSGFTIATSLALEFLYPIADPRIRQEHAR